MSTSMNSEAAAVAALDPAHPSPSTETRGSAGLTGSARHWCICLGIACLGCLALTVDLPISQLMVEGNWPEPWQGWRGAIHAVLEAVEPFGRPPAVISVSLAVWLCAGTKRGLAWRILVGALGPGLCVDVLKISVARVRPRHFNFQGTIADTFHSFFPGTAGGSHIQSWPSGHTATAVGFCLALSTVFPRGRWLFRSLAIMVAMQRIETGAHYLSDTLFATAVAYALWIVVFCRARNSPKANRAGEGRKE